MRRPGKRSSGSRCRNERTGITLFTRRGKLTGFLLSYRLRWYALATSRSLLRHWQAVVLALGVLSPGAMPVLLQLKLLAFPVLTLFFPGHGVSWLFAYLTLLEAAGLAWSAIQRKTIAGGVFAGYENTLPLSAGQRRRVNLGVLFLADGLLWIPVVAGLIVFAALPLEPMDKVFRCLAGVTPVLLVLLAQLGGLEENPRLWLAVLAINLLQSVALTLNPGGLAGLLQSVATIAAVYLVFNPPTRRRHAHRLRHGLSLPGFRLAARYMAYPYLPLQAEILLKGQTVSGFFRLGIALGLAWGAQVLYGLERFDERAMPTALIGMAGVALVLSGYFRVLQAAHDPMAGYARSLPWPAGFLLRGDTAAVLALGFPLMGLILYPLWAVRLISPMAAILTGLLFMLLTALLRFTQLNGGRQPVLLSALLASAWTALAWFFLL